jgi:nitroreductase
MDADAENRLKPLLTRRSTSVRDLIAPAPSNAQIESILRVATRVPDHGKLCPWRLVVLDAQGAQKLGEQAAAIFEARTPDATPAQVEAERQRFARAPLCIAVLSTPVRGTKPIWEQQLSAGAVCMNMLHAAHALGYGGKWLTEWVAYEPSILEALGGIPGDDQIAGFIYFGSKALETPDRERPDLTALVRYY